MWKLSEYGVFSGPNVGKYRPEKTRYLDNFHAVNVTGNNFQLAEFSFNLVKGFVLLKRDFQSSIYFK